MATKNALSYKFFVPQKKSFSERSVLTFERTFHIESYIRDVGDVSVSCPAKAEADF